MTQFQLEQRDATDPRVVVLALTGELDLTNADELEERVENVVSTASALVLDLTRVAFVDSAALHVLFRAARQLGKARFGLAFQPRAAIARTFEIVRIADVATVGESVDELTAALTRN